MATSIAKKKKLTFIDNSIPLFDCFVLGWPFVIERGWFLIKSSAFSIDGPLPLCPPSLSMSSLLNGRQA